jgi:Tol biopolymer transport system component
MITAGGQVKVVDFGLAKLTETESGVDSTATATVAGTPAYMSPEQAEGKKVDARSDIFSFGAVLYEMLAGNPAFGRGSSSETLGAVLRDDPALLPNVALPMRRLIARCLQKDANERYQSIADVRFALEEVTAEQTASLTVPKNRSRRLALQSGLYALLLAGVGWGGFWFYHRIKSGTSPPQVTQVTFDGRLAMHPSISADGKYVAYASDRAGEGSLDIWVQALPHGEPVRLTHDDANEDYPSFSPNGTEIAFLSERDGGTVRVVPVLGGEPRLLLKRRAQPHYSPDGKYLLLSVLGFINYNGFTLVPSQGGEPREFTPTGEEAWLFPVWSPDSSKILCQVWIDDFIRPGWRILAISDGKTVMSYQNNRSAVGDPMAWTRKNRILFTARSGDAVNLWQANLSSDWKAVEPFDELTHGSGRIDSASASEDGTIVFTNASTPTRLWSFARPPGKQLSEGDLQAIPSRGGMDYFPSLSSTGTMAYLTNTAGKWDIWVRDLRTAKEKWIASAEGRNPSQVSLAMRPDGTQVAYSVGRGYYHVSIFVIDSSGGVPQRVCSDCGEVVSWAPDGTSSHQPDT